MSFAVLEDHTDDEDKYQDEDYDEDDSRDIFEYGVGSAASSGCVCGAVFGHGTVFEFVGGEDITDEEGSCGFRAEDGKGRHGCDCGCGEFSLLVR